MSQSPEDTNSGGEVVASYRRGWSALNQLIAQGRSFSGHERNRAFLNIRGNRFSAVEAACNLDYSDDSRAVAVCDWDFDGQVDFWVTNRTAPRLRFLHNTSDKRANGDFLGLRLRGTTCNRDAIGARIEVHIGAKEGPVIRTLHAGHGFLSQSSKWLHCGLGNALGIERVDVRWPGGARETFRNMDPNNHYWLTEGSGRSERVEPMSDALVNTPEDRATAEETSGLTGDRTMLVGRVPMPEWVLSGIKGPVLINLWSSNCSACNVELREWKNQEAAIRGAGLEIAAMCIDHFSGADRDLSDRFLDSIGFSFRRGSATPELVSVMDVMHGALIELQHPLPVPTSFLLDAKGRLAAIYKGRVGVDTLLRDAALLDAKPHAQRHAAVPFPGRWASNPFPPDPNRIIKGFARIGKDKEAIAYAKQFLAGARTYLEDQFANHHQQVDIVVNAHELLGRLLEGQRRYPEAARVYVNLLKLAPKNIDLHRGIGERLLSQNLANESWPHLVLAAGGPTPDAAICFNKGLAALGTDRLAEAEISFLAALALKPGDKETHYQLGVTLEKNRRPRKAATHYRSAFEIDPAWSPAVINLIELILADPDGSPTEIAEAIGLAEVLCKRSDYKAVRTLYLLARAYAADNQTESALKVTDDALALPLDPSAALVIEGLQSLRKKMSGQ